MSNNGEIYTAGKNFTLPPAVTAWTNSTSAPRCHGGSEDNDDDDDYDVFDGDDDNNDDDDDRCK